MTTCSGQRTGRLREIEGRRPVRALDFTSALYLGLRHGSGSLPPWTDLTIGRPAALAEPPGAEAVAEALAALQGCEAAVLAPSTLHLFWDLFGALDRRTAIYLDAGTYPIARWGVERAAARGLPVRRFAHHDPDDLDRRLRQDAVGGRVPLVVTDGFCPACNRAAPLADYLAVARPRAGSLVIDDTQALGVLGERPRPEAPFGRGGGGSLRWGAVAGPDMLVISSLAKGFGAPLAVLASCVEAIRRFEERSETRVHCSPPSVAAIRAGERALTTNDARGDALRLRLWRLVRLFQGLLGEAGVAVTGGDFPVQTLAPAPGLDPARLHRRLLALGIRALLRRDHDGGEARIGFLLTARHEPPQIERAVAALAGATRGETTTRGRRR